MSLICYDGKTIAADSFVSSYNDESTHRTQKLFRMGEYIFGFTGSLSDGLIFVSLFSERVTDLYTIGIAAGISKEFPPDKANMSGLLLSPRGLFVIDSANDFVPVFIEGKYAIGSGSEYAQCLLDSGVSAKKTIKRCSKKFLYVATPIYYSKERGSINVSKY